MRSIRNLNGCWEFIKENISEIIDIPHTWNALDGQDGGDDYYRGICVYRKPLSIPKSDKDCEYYLEFCGVNAIAEVFINGQEIGRHEGGYSKFRFNITEAIAEENVIEVRVDNRSNDSVYPQKADFTFYGGIYRDVNLIVVSKVHFELDYYGTPGIAVTPRIIGKDAEVSVKTYIKGAYDAVQVRIDGLPPVKTGNGETAITIPNVHLWNGIQDPFLYRVTAELLVDDQIVDKITTTFGCRSYSFDAESGFLLNGERYPLHGVSRHQDFAGVGNAITKEMQDLDMELILEMGATSVRLAHYQHDQYFYDLCDKKGLIVWAEIPYITEHMPKGRANTISQMKELIVQNYNHPSIVLWALSNEIGVAGVTEDLLENHKILHDLAHQMDCSRMTAIADAFMLETDSPLNEISDIIAYNLYYGWYMGNLEDNDVFFEEFHKKYPHKCIGLTEYGADASHLLQSPHPKRGDYSEQYQAIYHEYMLSMFDRMPYLWGTYVWNMFDFGADGRDEARDNGKNHKGLVSIDRTVKKDSFYIYKAWWSNEPFVHLCGKRYQDRVEAKTEVKVYSNQKKVSLYLDGTKIEEQEGSHVFCFSVNIHGEHQIKAVSGECEDAMQIRKVKEANPAYYLETSSVRNWFDEPGMEIVPGCYSIQNTLAEIRQHDEARIWIDEMIAIARAARGEVTKSVKRTPQMEQMIYRNTVIEFAQMAGGAVTTEMVIELNQKLTKIKMEV